MAACKHRDFLQATRFLFTGFVLLQVPKGSQVPAHSTISCEVAGSCQSTFHKFLRGRRFLSVHIPQVPARSQVLVRAQSPVHAKLHRFLRILRFLRCRALWVTSVPGRQRVNILSDRDDIAPAPVTISKPDLAIPKITATYIFLRVQTVRVDQGLIDPNDIPSPASADNAWHQWQVRRAGQQNRGN
jgi:hypothetical protein